MRQSIIKPDFFIYAIPLTNLTPGQILTPQINFSNDSDFKLFEVRAICFPTDTQTAGVTFQMSVSNGSLLSNVGLEIMAIASNQDGSALHQDVSGYPIRLPEPVVIPANTTLNVQLQNNDAAVSVNNIQILLIGYKVEKQS